MPRLHCPLLAACLAAACSGEPAAPAGPATRANVLLIVVDTLRADLGGERCGSPATPNLDRLAAEGIAFQSAFSHAPMTLPAHAALFSSRAPHASGVLNNGRPVPDDLPLLAEHLRANGYRTHAVVSLGTLVPTRGPGLDLARGFDVYEDAGWGFINTGEQVCAAVELALDALAEDEAPFFLFAHFSDPHEPYNDHRLAPDSATLALDGVPLAQLGASNMSLWQAALELAPGPHRLDLRAETPLRLRRLELERGGQRLATRFTLGRLKLPATALSVEFDVPADADGPVRVGLWLTDHVQRHQVPARYGSEVAYVDGQVGRLLDALSERGLDDDTLVVFTSDHGESLGERRFIGHVKSLDDELIHVPLVLRLPACLEGAQALAARSEDVVGHVDVVPTLLELLELPVLAGQTGRSLLGQVATGPVLAETHPPEAPQHLVALRDRSVKLVYDVGADRFSLFDLALDPGERSDVLPGRAEEFAGWLERLREVGREGRRVGQGAPALTAAATETLSALGYLE